MRPDQQTLLDKPFEFEEHGFKKENIYIRKSAIRRRLSQVDPQWKLSPPEFVCVDGDVVIMRGSLTVCGITRHQIGSGIIQRKESGGKMLEGYSLGLMVAKAYKEAATMILARAAVEFNCGSYLKDVSVDDKPSNPERLKTLLKKMAHWGYGGGRERVSEMLKVLGLDWPSVNSLIEPNRTLESLSDTTLTEAQFMKRLVELTLKPAQPKTATESAAPAPAAPLPIIECHANDLRPGDVIRQQFKPINGGTAETRSEVVENWGKLGNGYKLTVKDLATGEVKSVHWTGNTWTLVDGPKCEAYAKDLSVCLPARNGSKPMWSVVAAAV